MNIFKNILMEKISVQFISDESKVRLISICEQVLKKNTFFTEYIIMEKLSKSKRKEIFNLVKKLTKIFSLKGINNIDLIEKENILYLIEINSRPGLSSKIIYEINGGPFIKEEKNQTRSFMLLK